MRYPSTINADCGTCGGAYRCPACKGASFVQRIDREMLGESAGLCSTCSGSGTCPHCFALVLDITYGLTRPNGA
jgi:hypothetical protein